MSTVDPKFLSQLRYRSIGPTRGGRVVAVAADPNNQAVFYFGAVAGGVWKSDDAGQYWQNISDGFFKTSSVGALAVAPSDPNVIYAGMGETTIRIDVSHGDGVYKTTDAGKTWQHMGLTESRHIGKIRVHPNNPDLLYVAALGHAFKDNPERGVYRSKDGGQTWENVLHVSERAGAVDISMDPNNPRILFATIWQARRTFWSIDSGGPDSGLWRSKDGGDSWENISQNKGMPSGTLGKMGVSISPARSNRVWAMVEAEGRKRGLYRSDDGGDSWEHISAKAELGWRPWYYEHVVAHPTDPDTVFVLNMMAWKSVDGGKNFEQFPTPHGDNHDLWIDPNNPERMIGSDDGGAWVSLNGGRSWSTIYNQPTAQFYHVAVDNQYPYRVYGSQQDNSSISVPSQTGSGAINWGDCYPPGTAESGYVAPHPEDPNIVYVGAIGSSPGGGDALQRYDHRTKQIQLVNVWPEPYHDGETAEYRFQWTYPIVFSPQDPRVLYATGNKVFRSEDEGHSWEAISPDLTYADPATLGVSGPLTMDTAGAEMYATIFSFMASAHRPGALMAGSDDGLVHMTLDNGEDWSNVTPADLPKFSQVTMLAESPHNAGTVYMTAARHKMGDYTPYVYKTTDFGKSWQKIVSGLPGNDFLRVIREDPARQGLLYAGGESGIYVSFDDGQNWQSLQGNLPISPVYDFVIKDNDLVIATHGRSFWILDDLTQIHQLHDEAMAADAHLFQPRDAVRTPLPLFADFFTATGGKSYHTSLGQNATYIAKKEETGELTKTFLDAGADPPRGVRVTYYFKEKPEAEVKLTIMDASGDEIISYSSAIPEKKEDREGLYITANAGMNSFVWPMKYPDGEKMVDSEFHGRPGGPLAMPGAYSVKLTAGDWSMSQPFNLVKDPRVTTSDADLQAQFDLQKQIYDKMNEMIKAVNQIRDLKKQLQGWSKRLKDHDRGEAVAEAAKALKEKLEAVENALVQVELKSMGDALNYREMLIEKLSSLPSVVGSADKKPTKQSYAVYDKLAGQADEQLAVLKGVLAEDLAALNTLLASLDVGMVVT